MTILNVVKAQLKIQRREHAKWWVGRLFYPQATARWLNFVQAHAVLLPYVARFPRLVTRIYRPYGYRPLRCGQRVDLMIGHYQWLERLGLAPLLTRCIENGWCQAEVDTKSGEKTSLHLNAIHDGHREGKMSLQLHWAEHFLFTLNFVLVQDAEGCALLVTRLQGKDIEHGREKIRLATKSMYGMRPAALLLQAARQWAHSAGCSNVLMVSNHQRVALNPMRRFKIKSNNDALWKDLGAVQRPDGFFCIGTEVPLPQDFSDVASSKRAEAKRKAELTDRLLTRLATSIQDCRQVLKASSV